MIRPAQSADAPTMAAIYAPYVEETTVTFEYSPPDSAEMAKRLEDYSRRFPWLVYEEAGEILGYAYASPPFSRPAYAWCAEPSIYLRRDARGRGIGRQLYQALEDILTRQGYQVLYAIITGENQPSVAFHSRMGYQKLAVFPDCAYKFGRSLSVVWMEKRLKPVEIPRNFPTPWKELVQNT